MTLSDLRGALRAIARDRGFSITATLVLVLAIGANLMVFALINGIYLRPLPIAEPDRVLAIGTTTKDAARPDNMSVPDLRDLQARLRTFAGVEAVDEVPVTIFDADRGAERVSGAYVTGTALSMIGASPIRGRTFTASDDMSGAEPVALLGQALWRSRYEGDPGIIGRTIQVDGTAATVIGVMPEGFGFPTDATIWLPLGARDVPAFRDRGARVVDVFGRLADGVTVEQASAELTAVMTALAAEHPDTNAGVEPYLGDLRDNNTGGPVWTVAVVLFTSVGLVLVIACANVANLLLARSTVRARELALRLSLGATRARVLRQLLIESLVLSAIAAAIAVPGARMGLSAFHAAIRGTGEPYWLAFPIDLRVGLFGIALVTLTAILFGLAPAIQATGRSLVDVLGSGTHTIAGSRRHRRVAGGLVVAQVALMLTVLSSAGVMLRDVGMRAQADAGIDVENLVSMQVDLPERTYPGDAARRLFYQRLDEQLAAVPGVSAGTGTWAPLRGAFFRPVSIDGNLPAAERVRQPRVSNLMIGTTYFEAIGIRPTNGRSFTAGDGPPGAPVAIVNEHFAARFFGDAPALGRQLALDAVPGVPATGWVTIVGIVPDVRHDELDERIREAVVYLPHAQTPLASTRVVVRAQPDVAAATDAVRAAVARVDPTLPIVDVARVREALASDLIVFRIFGTLAAVFAAMAVLLAAVGLYGITAYSVVTRRRELSLRTALGAPVRHLLWAVTRRTVGQTIAGLALGAVGAGLMGLLVRGLLTSISPLDPVTMLSVGLLCLLTAFVACIGPAWRAIRTDPVTVLREA